MNWIDYIIIAIVALVLGFSVWFIRKSKKSGKKCIGCPSGGSCASGCGSCPGCGNTSK